ncbi:hypothetical protein [Streptococcus suis]|nr:hypothetical protein [Streptococcus suis]
MTIKFVNTPNFFERGMVRSWFHNAALFRAQFSLFEIFEGVNMV